MWNTLSTWDTYTHTYVALTARLEDRSEIEEFVLVVFSEIKRRQK